MYMFVYFFLLHPGFKYELALCLNGAITVPNLRRQEKTLFSEFRVKGQLKMYFNYLLIDPTVVKSLDTTVQSNVTNLELFQSFIEGIFYVGKGKNSRSFQHLKDTKKRTATQDRVSCTCTSTLVGLFYSYFLLSLNSQKK